MQIGQGCRRPTAVGDRCSLRVEDHDEQVTRQHRSSGLERRAIAAGAIQCRHRAGHKGRLSGHGHPPVDVLESQELLPRIPAQCKGDGTNCDHDEHADSHQQASLEATHAVRSIDTRHRAP